MADLPARLVEVGAFFGQGYQPVLDFHGWRVARLRSAQIANAEAFHRVERHRETNEVFILTAGEADLIVCDGDARPGEAFVTAMELNVAYNIGRSVWHNVVMSPDAHIVLFERTDTTVDNSDYADLPPEQVGTITARFHIGRNT